MQRTRTGAPPRLADYAIPTALALSALGSGVWLILGGPLVPLWIVTLVAGFVLLTRRLSIALSAAFAVTGFLLLQLFSLLVSPLMGFGISAPSAALSCAVCVAAVATAIARPRRPANLRTRVPLAIASLVPSAIFLTSIAATQVLPRATRLDWAMNGDSVNSMVFARLMLADGGIDQSSTPQTTPLPFAMAAANMAPGRASLMDSALLAHDVARATQVWVMIIAVSLVLVGVVIALSTRALSPRLRLLTSALLPLPFLSWFIIGMQFEYGFISSAYAISLLVCAWLFYTQARERPLLGLVGITITALALLPVWSPLVICVVGLAIIIVVRGWRQLRQARRAHLAIAMLAPVAAIAYVLAFTLPDLLAQSAALGNDGGFPDVGPKYFVVVLAIAAASCVMAVRAGMGWDSLGGVAIVLGTCVGLAYLLYQRIRGGFVEEYWGYYPAKFAWTASILIAVVSVSLVVGALARAQKPAPWVQAISVAAIGIVLTSLFWGPVRPLAQLPLAEILTGTFVGSNGTVDRLFELSGRENGQDVLWRTAAGDYWSNFWLLQVDVDDSRTNPVRTYAHVGLLAPDQMCAVIELLGSDVIIHTDDPAAEAELNELCGTLSYTVQIN